MAVRIEYVIECPHGCDENATSGVTLDMTADDCDDGIIRIDVDMAVSQTVFTCCGCGCRFYTGDLEDFLFSSDECALVDGDPL